jgi:hypothetical protein
VIEDIVGIDLTAQNEIDQFGQAKSLWCTLQKAGRPGLELADRGRPAMTACGDESPQLAVA